MYLAISAAWAACLAAAIIGWKQTARRLAVRERENAALAAQCESFERAGKLQEQLLGLRESEYDEVLHALHDAERVETTLRQERRRLEEALIAEREAAAHWKEQFQREQAWRLTTEGRILREVNNMLAYDGTGRGQEDVSE